MNKLTQVKSKVSSKVSTRVDAKMMSQSRVQTQTVGLTMPKTLAKGKIWSTETMSERDFTYKAKCRCTTPDLTEGLSMCVTGCGNPNQVCSTDFGCTNAESGCNKNKCTCMPDGIDTNTMTYQECFDQCAAVDMIMIEGEEAVALAKGTGCNIDG